MFTPTEGYENCPKCGGWQIADKTPRNKNGWPLKAGVFVYENCDNCFGRGELPIAGFKPNKGWQWTTEPVAPPKEIVSIDAPLPMPKDTVNRGWAIFDKDK